MFEVCFWLAVVLLWRCGCSLCLQVVCVYGCGDLVVWCLCCAVYAVWYVCFSFAVVFGVEWVVKGDELYVLVFTWVMVDFGVFVVGLVYIWVWVCSTLWF